MLKSFAELMKPTGILAMPSGLNDKKTNVIRISGKTINNKIERQFLINPLIIDWVSGITFNKIILPRPLISLK